MKELEFLVCIWSLKRQLIDNFHQASPQLPGGHIGVLGVMGRYQTDDMALTGQISNSGSLHATFYQKCSENLQIGVEMETNLKMQACRHIYRS